MDLFTISFVGFIGLMFWVMACNSRTCYQRKNYINLWPSGKLFDAHVKANHNVSYEAHMWRLITFRNPWKIYPAITRNLMDKPHA